MLGLGKGNTRPSPDTVFTPRAASVNERMYVVRADLEGSLSRALSGQKHILVHGESGSGKSWLYKRVLAQVDAEYVIADLANASRFKSITAEFSNLLDRRERPKKTGYVEKKSAGLNTPIAKGELAHEGEYELASKEPFEKCLEYLRRRAKGKQAVLVWDNFERLLTNEELVAEAANLIALSDNPDYAAYNIKILIVGVPADIREYLSRVDQSNTVANRLAEIPEVSRLSKEQAHDLVRRGFVGELGYKFHDELLNNISSHVAWVSDRIPQHVHEYCLELANIGEDQGGSITSEDLETADERWVKSSLIQSYAVIESHMNARRTEAGRRNQAIYAIGCCSKFDFRYTDIEELIRSEFADSTKDKQLGVSQILETLAGGDQPLIKRTPKGDAYRLVNPKYRMCIRAVLEKDASGNRVERKSFEEE